jgi:hypothetical protein
MSRVINPDSTGKERAYLSKAIVLAVRELAKQNQITAETRDLAAFVALALAQISAGIDSTVEAWEKRDYWIKADRFRMDWQWTGLLGTKMKQAIFDEDWPQVAQISIQAAEKFNKIRVAEKHRLGKPWLGAYKQLREEKRL